MPAIILSHLRKAAFVVAACVSIVSPAQPQIDILQIWQNFVASRAAAEACGGVEKDTDTHFLANLSDVRIRALQALQERNPDAPKDELPGRMTVSENAVHAKVDEEIKKNGCSSDRIEQLLKMYKMHSTMHL